MYNAHRQVDQVALSYNYPVLFFCRTSQLLLDGFDQHFRVSVHFPLTNDVVKSQQHPNTFFGNAKNQTHVLWVRSNASPSLTLRSLPGDLLKLI